MKKFWQLIEKDLAEKYGHDNPSTWPAQIIYNVLDHMEGQVIEACKADKNKAIACGVTFKEGKAYDVSKNKKWQIVDLTTFKRIFKDKKGGGQTRTQNIFAIALGYLSVADYLEKKEVFEKIEANQEPVNPIESIEKKLPIFNINRKKYPYIIGLAALAGLTTYSIANGVQLSFNPFLITGIGLFLFFGIHRLIILSGLIQPFSEKEGSSIVRLILKYGFYIALATAASGVIASSFGIWDVQNRSVVAVDVIKDEAMDACTEMAGLIWGIKQMAPEAYYKKEAREFTSDYQSKVKSHYQGYLSELNTLISKYPLQTDIHDAYKINLSDKTQATAFNSIYNHLEESRAQLFDLQEQLQGMLSYTIKNEELAKRILLKQKQKVLESRIALALACSEFALMLQDEVEIFSLSNAIKMAGFSLTEKDPKLIWKQMRQQMAQLYEEKQKLLSQESGFPLLINSSTIAPKDTVDPKLDSLLAEADAALNKMYTQGSLITEDEFVQLSAPHAKRAISGRISNPYLQQLRAKEGLPPDSLTLAEKWAINHDSLNTTENDPTQLLVLAVLAFYGSDEEGVKYYLKKALKNKQLSDIQRQFLQLSLQRIEKPDLYDESLGVMVVKVLSNGAFQMAGIQPGDVIYKVNGAYVQEPFDISKLTTGKGAEDVHFFEFYRAGRYKNKAVKANSAIGAQLTQLIAWDIVQL